MTVFFRYTLYYIHKRSVYIKAICVYIVNLSRMNLVQDEYKLIAPGIELNDVRNNIKPK